MDQSFRTIDRQEYEDFLDECEARGLDPQEFSLNEHEVLQTEVTPTTCIINAKLTISRGLSSRTYVTGEGTDWLVLFAKDLRNGVFN